MLTIYGSPLSVPVNKVRYVANALGLDYDFKLLNLKEGEHKTPQYLEIHPAGKIPAIDDDGFTLFESNAIARYLATNASNRFYPTAVRERAKVDQWIDFSTIHVGGAVGRVFFNKVLAPVFGMDADQASLKCGLEFLDNFLPVVNAQLGKGRYLAGDEITLADFSLLAVCDPLEISEIKTEKYSDLLKWQQGLQKEAFYTKCHASYTEMVKQLGS